jgi:hypothetical protein
VEVRGLGCQTRHFNCLLRRRRGHGARTKDVLQAGFDVDEQDIPASQTVRVVDMTCPSSRWPAAIYRGGDDGMAVGESLVSWIQDCGFPLVGDCREALPTSGTTTTCPQQRQGPVLPKLSPAAR